MKKKPPLGQSVWVKNRRRAIMFKINSDSASLMHLHQSYPSRDNSWKQKLLRFRKCPISLFPGLLHCTLLGDRESPSSLPSCIGTLITAVDPHHWPLVERSVVGRADYYLPSSSPVSNQSSQFYPRLLHSLLVEKADRMNRESDGEWWRGAVFEEEKKIVKGDTGKIEGRKYLRLFQKEARYIYMYILKPSLTDEQSQGWSWNRRTSINYQGASSLLLTHSWPSVQDFKENSFLSLTMMLEGLQHVKWTLWSWIIFCTWFSKPI